MVLHSHVTMNQFGSDVNADTDAFLQYDCLDLTSDWTLDSLMTPNHGAEMDPINETALQPPSRWSTVTPHPALHFPRSQLSNTHVTQPKDRNGASNSPMPANLAGDQNMQTKTLACPVHKADNFYKRPHSCRGVSAKKMFTVCAHLTGGKQPHLPFLGFCKQCSGYTLEQQEFKDLHGENCGFLPYKPRGDTASENQWRSLFSLMYPDIDDIPEPYNATTETAHRGESRAYNSVQNSGLHSNPSTSSAPTSSLHSMALQVTASREPSMFMEPIGSPAHLQQTEHFSGGRITNDPDSASSPHASLTFAMPNKYSSIGLTITPFNFPETTQLSLPCHSSQELNCVQDGNPQNMEPGLLDSRQISQANGSEPALDIPNTNHDVEESIVNVNSNDETARSDTARHASSYDDLHVHGAPSNSSISTDDTSSTLHCGICSFSFTGEHRKGNRQRHWRLKHRAQAGAYPCMIQGCTKVYQRSDALLKHKRRRHPVLSLAPAITRKALPDSHKAHLMIEPEPREFLRRLDK